MLKIEKVQNLQEKIDSIFVEQAKEHNIDSNYKDFKFAVKDDNGNILGGTTGHKLFNEIYISDLFIDKSYRK